MPVLGTKLHMPPPRARLVQRTRITDRLRAGVDDGARLVLVAAPAGFGKTTLLAQWLSGGTGRRAAWLALDPGDSDVRRFLTHLVAAVRTVRPEVGADALALLEADVATSTEAVLTSLINDLDVFAGPTVVALDDYHVVDGADVHEAVTLLVDNLPAQVALAMTTRADPPLPLARLRARGELVEIRAADLRFSADEAEVFLNEVMGLRLEPALVSALEARTEGWAAGLQLAALSVRDHAGDGEVAGFVETFSGSHRFVLDYLVDEVLDRQPEHVREFLLDTSVLDQLTGGLCDDLTGRADGRSMLETLERGNLFVVPLDDERRWYRYHHLFADVLRARLSARDADRLGSLHAAAGRWLARNGLTADAVRHGLASGDVELAADLVELGLADLRRRRENSLLRDWLTALPQDVVRRRPLLATYLGWTRLSRGDVDGVEPWLEAAEAGLGTASPRPATGIADGFAAGTAAGDREGELRGLPAMIEVYRASVAQARRDVEGTVSHARRALTLAGPEDHFPRGAAAGFIGLAAWAAGDLATAVTTFTEAVASLRAAGMVADELGGTVVLSALELARGRPAEARRLCEHALAEAKRRSVLSTTGDLHVGLAEILCEQGELDAAATHLGIARELGDRASVAENRHRWYVTRAALLRAQRDLDGAVAMLDRAESLFLPGYFPDVRPIAATKARVRIEQGRLEEARAWAGQRGVAPTDPPAYLAEHDQLTLARLLVAEGDAEVAVDLAGRVLDAAQAADRGRSLVEARLVRALALDAGGAPDAAADLTSALRIGVPAGYRRLFLDEGPRMVDLLEGVARRGAPDVRHHAGRLLTAAEGTRPGQAPAPEGLSERELDVLHLLATELTGPEIARRLFVSVNTLRTHTRHIFTKLDVNTRRAAVRRASDLGLL